MHPRQLLKTPAIVLLCLTAVKGELSPIGLERFKRNLGGPLKDWYLMKMTKNYLCTDTGRVVPVDPETGHMLVKGLRRRGVDDFFHLSHSTEHGSCKDATWVLPYNWNQPIPKVQFEAQYPWMYVDESGQMRFKPDYLEWLQQQGASRASQDKHRTTARVESGIGTASAVPAEALGNGIVAGVPATISQ